MTVFSEHRLDVSGYRGQQVPTTFVRQEATAAQLAILLPGFGYSCDMPLFYYAGLHLLNSGCDVLRVEYAYNRQPGFRELPLSDQIEWQVADATAAFGAARRQYPYQQITLVGKSIGTRAMGQLLTDESRQWDAQAIWLTPLLNDDNLRQEIRQSEARSLFVIGTADPHYDAEFLTEISESSQNSVVTIANGDHSLDIAGDVAGSIQALSTVVHSLDEFLSR